MCTWRYLKRGGGYEAKIVLAEDDYREELEIRAVLVVKSDPIVVSDAIDMSFRRHVDDGPESQAVAA